MDFAAYRVIQAPMAGTSTVALAAAVAVAGGFPMLAFGALDADGAAAAMADLRARWDGPFGVNLFCHTPPRRDPTREAAWIDHLRPAFAGVGATPPGELTIPYTSFRINDALFRTVLAARPAVIGVHFGLPRADQIATLTDTGATLIATATSEPEARLATRSGIRALIAQGWQAGGHRGIFDTDGPDERLSTLDLTRQLARVGVPVIAAGGIMSAADAQAARDAGAVAVQCGTAYLNADECGTPPAHRAALAGGQTQMTRAISGRPARCLLNRFTAIEATNAPDYPLPYSVGKALHAAASAAGDSGYGAFWAGTGAAQAIAAPAATITAMLRV
ncbi:MAG: nitronate monooxygenase [Paracoccus sp. (in: a-proteobacteria)]|uniref:NAD(P)H-dependent flavin oxidoreductase n=1 Tax=Paracoccus sp. TaxID=267 RepID=UPI0026E09765|nr:nitronate monooxygenase [Paracoccus sp. (in: a-proteobacteria)]MDO5632585.1 nitronate monooxygenase [Paracoccus sp. (in: a-proteobacteria)]